MTAPDLILLDTSVVLHVIRGNEVAQRMDDAINLSGRPERPLVSIVTLGEAQAFAEDCNWGPRKSAQLAKLFRELVVVDIDLDAILERYANFHTYMKRGGYSIGDNDLWIAACATGVGATLVTNDKDFDPLAKQGLQHLYFDPNPNPK